MNNCTKYTTCRACTSHRGCGYIASLDKCVEGNWRHPVDSSYFYGQCYLSTQTEVVVAGVVLMVVFVGSVVSALRKHRRWAHRPGEDETDALYYYHEEHVPLLIDNDPSSKNIVAARDAVQKSSISR